MTASVMVPGGTQTYAGLLRTSIGRDFRQTLREPGGGLGYPFLAPGSAAYPDVLWDWDSWTSNWALRQIALDAEDPELVEEIRPYERGCILNFLSCPTAWTGWLPISLGRGEFKPPPDLRRCNLHKPCLAQHAAFLVRQDGGDIEWLRPHFPRLAAFVQFWLNHHTHRPTGLVRWYDDHAIGVDNDPCTYGRPVESSGSIFLNCLMVRELEEVAWLAALLGLEGSASAFVQDAARLREAIREHCWDEWTGFYYSVDLNIRRSVDPLPQDWGSNWGLHCGYPPDWDCLIQRIGVWSGFLALWAGVATPQQARRMAAEHYSNPATFGAVYGVRTLSRMEKMYNLRPMGNPSSWLGPVWGISNYLTWSGLVRYGLVEEARDLALKTVALFGRDLERFAALHEYYEPDSGEPVMNRGFQNWNHLVLNMLAWLEERPCVREIQVSSLGARGDFSGMSPRPEI